MSYSTPASFEAVAHRFKHHPPTDERATLHEEARALFETLSHWIDSNVPPSRERSISQTNLEDTLMWVNAAIARNL